MPNIRIIKLKIRRGSEVERRQIVLEQGELGYTVDTRRLFVGNGSLSGGDIVGSKVHNILSTSNTRNLLSEAYQGDLVYENNLLYQLTGADFSNLSEWAFIGSRTDESSIEYNSSRELHIKDSGVTAQKVQNGAITGNKLNTNVLYQSGGLSLTTAGISANIDNDTFLITNSNVITIAPSGVSSDQLAADAVNQNNIDSTALDKGLVGGDGNALSARIDNDTIVFNNDNEISIGTVYGSNIGLGTGMEIGPGDTLTHFIQRVNPAKFTVDSNRLDLKQNITYNNRQYNSPNIVVDKAGFIRSISNNICLPLSSNNATYGGYAAQTSGSESRNTNVIATTGVGSANYTLSSAGFMVVRIGTPNITTGDARDFLNAQYVAMPIFTLPDEIITFVEGRETVLYPFPFFGFRAHNPDGSEELTTDVLTGAACSGVDDFTGYSSEFDIYTATSSLSIGTVVAATVNALSTDEIPTLSGWWAIDDKLYFVNNFNVITLTGEC